jgi:cytochrome c oxidase assembly protein subunit 20
MEDDTRQSDAQAQPKPKAPANIMPGGMAHTAGGNKDDIGPSYFEVVKQLGPEYYMNFHKRPCVRDGQLTGIGAGFVGGSLMAILGSKSLRFCWYPMGPF